MKFHIFKNTTCINHYHNTRVGFFWFYQSFAENHFKGNRNLNSQMSYIYTKISCHVWYMVYRHDRKEYRLMDKTRTVKPADISKLVCFFLC